MMTLFKSCMLLALLVTSTRAFAPISTTSHQHLSTLSNSPFMNHPTMLPSLQRQRKSVATIQMQGLFGLGAPEIAIIAVAAAFLLGPQKIAEMGRDAGKMAGELKDVPKEFQKGLEEGEIQARATKAKNMEEIASEQVELAESKKE
ncbi:hypothetical protein MPSEU_000591900 [Mayamaea pseudoterrestris]|nr:hypothetical protein MPSEU_000591900 [Mayamaea pseudoterrestris]